MNLSIFFRTIGKSIIRLFLFLLLPSVSFAQAANDLCGNALPLTSGTTCQSITGDLQGATSTGSPSGSCAGAISPTNDVWYYFTASSANATITVGGFSSPSNLTATTTYVEVLTGTCATTLTSLTCQNVSTPMNLTTLTVGATYYVRVYVIASTTSGGNPNRRGFTICLQSSPNDEPVSAASLTPGTSCSPISGSLLLATMQYGITRRLPNGR